MTVLEAGQDILRAHSTVETQGVKDVRCKKVVEDAEAA